MPQLEHSPTALDRADVLERFAVNRRRTRALFDLLDESLYYERPISLRNPIVFYEGHIPAFAVNTLIKKALGQKGVDERLETIFARGIDPESEATSIARGNPAWPSRREVRQFVEAADRLVEQAISSADLERSGDPMLDRARALWTILEHEEMHQETLGYIWHQVPHSKKHKPGGYRTETAPPPRADSSAHALIRSGIATLGTDLREHRFAWDNELPSHHVDVNAFAIDVHKVTNRQFMDFVRDGSYHVPQWWRPADWEWIESNNVSHPFFWERDGDRWLWRGMFEHVPLPDTWPVYVTWAEANAFARWRRLRLPTEAEYHRAAFGIPDGRERTYPWGQKIPDPVPGNFDFRRWDPEPVGAHPEGVSAFGVHDLIGNGWEWTSTTFAPFDGFTPLPTYPEYSADFFDGDHFVMKGASPLTARTLVRRGFRNWFRPHYPYVYATFRCAGEA
jgi:gamma-glutamyl hercynylcysteine S-oxide synthase